MRPTDQMLARYAAELEDRNTFIDGLVEAAENEARDLNPNEMELVTRARERVGVINENMQPLQEARRISNESIGRIAEFARQMETQDGKKPREVEYRSAGAYVLDVWKAGLGAKDAVERLDLFNRAAAHQTTGDNPGLLPQQILGPVINYVDTARPLVNALGPRQLPSGSWSRPQVTQHTQVGAQSAEKGELVSRKMTIAKIPVAPTTYGGYVNVSRQDIDWTQPQIMDLVIADLAGQYAIQTELALGGALVAGGTAADASTTIPTGAATAAGVSSAVWAAAGKVLAATQGQGTLLLAVSPDMMGVIGPVFPPVNPQNAQSPGFTAGNVAPGTNGSISGVVVVMSAGLAAGTILMISTSAAEVYEDRIGALQVVEPSVLGVQVAYAGYFANLVLLATGIQKIAKTP